MVLFKVQKKGRQQKPDRRKEIQNMMDINVNLLQWFITFLIKSLLVQIFQVVLLHVEINLLLKLNLSQTSALQGFDRNRKLAEELHKPIIRKIEKRKVYSSFKDNICGADLADM